MTPAHLAARLKTPAFLEMIIEYGGLCDPDPRNDVRFFEFLSLLSLLSLSGLLLLTLCSVDKVVVELQFSFAAPLFLSHRIASLQSGSTPLHVACGYNAFDCVQVLLDLGADPSIENNVRLDPCIRLKFMHTFSGETDTFALRRAQ